MDDESEKQRNAGNTPANRKAGAYPQLRKTLLDIDIAAMKQAEDARKASEANAGNTYPEQPQTDGRQIESLNGVNSANDNSNSEKKARLSQLKKTMLDIDVGKKVMADSKPNLVAPKMEAGPPTHIEQPPARLPEEDSASSSDVDYSTCVRETKAGPQMKKTRLDVDSGLHKFSDSGKNFAAANETGSASRYDGLQNRMVEADSEIEPDAESHRSPEKSHRRQSRSGANSYERLNAGSDFAKRNSGRNRYAEELEPEENSQSGSSTNKAMVIVGFMLALSLVVAGAIILVPKLHMGNDGNAAHKESLIPMSDTGRQVLSSEAAGDQSAGSVKASGAAGSVLMHGKKAGGSSSSSVSYNGPRYYTGIQVAFNDEQVPMTIDNMKVYNSTQISDSIPLYVSSIFPGSPAGKADLRLGDRILDINGENLNGLTIPQANDRLEGAPNSSISIGVRRGIQSPRTLSLVRSLSLNPGAVTTDTGEVRHKQGPAHKR